MIICKQERGPSMSSYFEEIKSTIEHISIDEIFVARELKNTKLKEIPENTFYKSLERLVKNGDLIHLAKGLYSRTPKSQEQIVDYYIADNNGMIVGEQLFFEMGLISRMTGYASVLSKKLNEDKKSIGNIAVEKVSIDLNENTIPVIETLEILQNYNKINNIDKNRFLVYMRKFSEHYSDDVVRYVIEHRKYKKSTIAFLNRILVWYGVENSLCQYLSPLSEYNIPEIDDLRASLPLEMKTRLKQYAGELKRIYKDKLDKVILYGSYARGDYTEESDVDIMILLSISDMEIKCYQELLSELTYDFNTTFEIDIKPIAKSKAEFNKWVNSYPFYSNIQKEGVELYGAA